MKTFACLISKATQTNIKRKKERKNKNTKTREREKEKERESAINIAFGFFNFEEPYSNLDTSFFHMSVLSN